jgi:uncharacterized membrane protein
MTGPAAGGGWKERLQKFTMDIMQWLTQNPAGEFCFTILVSMVPVVELRGGIPFGVARGLPVWAAYLAAIIGNMLPVPFILVYIRRIFQWMRRRLPRLNRLVDKLEKKAHLKGQKVTKYKYLGLMLFVAIPLPGTGAWTGALAAAFLDMPLRKAIPSIFAGVLAAGIAISILTFGVASLI